VRNTPAWLRAIAADGIANHCDEAMWPILALVASAGGTTAVPQRY
jgi:hypothetical protein